MILNESADNESLENAEDFIHDTFFPESITIAVIGRSSDLFPPCGLPTSESSGLKRWHGACSKLTATGIVPDSHRIPFSLDRRLTILTEHLKPGAILRKIFGSHNRNRYVPKHYMASLFIVIKKGTDKKSFRTKGGKISSTFLRSFLPSVVWMTFWENQFISFYLSPRLFNAC